MKKFLFALSVIAPFALFGCDSHANVETDILERSVNFFIFVSILYYLLADKLKTLFTDRTNSIRSELDKVQDLLKESEAKVSGAKLEVENAKKIANDLIVAAKNDVASIKNKIEVAVEQEIAFLSKSFDEKTNLELRKVKKEVVESILDQLLSNDNIALSQDEVANIILKKVA